MRLVVSMVRQTAEHLIRSKLSRGYRSSVERWRTSSVEPNDPVLKAARAYELLTFIYYFRGDKTRIIHATLRATNLAEHAQLAPILAVQYSNLGAICGVVPLRKRAEHYLGIASDLTKQLAMPTVTANVSLLSGLYWAVDRGGVRGTSGCRRRNPRLAARAAQVAPMADAPDEHRALVGAGRLVGPAAHRATAVAACLREGGCTVRHPVATVPARSYRGRSRVTGYGAFDVTPLAEG